MLPTFAPMPTSTDSCVRLVTGEPLTRMDLAPLMTGRVGLDHTGLG